MTNQDAKARPLLTARPSVLASRAFWIGGALSVLIWAAIVAPFVC